MQIEADKNKSVRFFLFQTFQRNVYRAYEEMLEKIFTLTGTEHDIYFQKLIWKN